LVHNIFQKPDLLGITTSPQEATPAKTVGGYNGSTTLDRLVVQGMTIIYKERKGNGKGVCGCTAEIHDICSKFSKEMESSMRTGGNKSV
jgi:hypothetical protein